MLLAYFILFFDIYWFYKSYSLVINAYRGAKRIKHAERQNWLEKAKALPDFKRYSMLSYSSATKKVLLK